jgi:1L-myo-inositol 1-phosphate cytidylyltransferase / CDP-L-myo-inositol myo-inositolphosphotransferase
MTKPSPPQLLIVADSPEALTELCGISLLERTRRVALRLGFREAMVLSNAVEAMAEHFAKQSWHRSDLSLMFRERRAAKVTLGDVLDCLAAMKVPSDGRILIVFAGFYCDGRLFRSLAQTQISSALIDSDPPSIIAPLLENSDAHSVGRLLCATLLSSEWFSGKHRAAALAQEVTLDTMTGQIASVDAAQQPAYVESMRRNLRPVFFPAPSPERRLLAERFLREETQSGVLDFPALVHAPIEKWIVSHVCRTSITPNQITVGTGILGLSVTLLYAFGHLSVGALLALLVGILDGVDGKLARLKVQTTRIGKGEHLLDYFVEMSWWAALAYHFHATGQVRDAYVIWLIFFACDSLERIAKWSVKRRVGRSIDDVSRFDRLVRYVAGRRNIYTWLFTFCLLTGAPATGFILLCLWGMATAAIHIFRALQIRYTFQNKIAGTAS